MGNNRFGTIEDGSTTSDFHPGEKSRKISIHSTPLHMEWMDKKFNLIDTPGFYSDFIGEALGALSVVDRARYIHSCGQWNRSPHRNYVDQATKLGIPKMLVVNGLDREHVKFDTVLSQARRRFGNNVFPMQLPVNPGPG
ncbi:hypothetical protein Ct9H90mP29_21810 [bacterium]|nr:MAG: hypothetical protein Ct9H90mP29_21810 [bacterium]